MMDFWSYTRQWWDQYWNTQILFGVHTSCWIKETGKSAASCDQDDTFIKWQITSALFNFTWSSYHPWSYRSIRGDLIFVYKLINGHFNLDFSTFLPYPPTFTPEEIYWNFTNLIASQCLYVHNFCKSNS